jgi:hypothetical protein
MNSDTYNSPKMQTWFDKDVMSAQMRDRVKVCIDASVPTGYVRDEQTGTIYKAATWRRRMETLARQGAT